MRERIEGDKYLVQIIDISKYQSRFTLRSRYLLLLKVMGSEAVWSTTYLIHPILDLPMLEAEEVPYK